MMDAVAAFRLKRVSKKYHVWRRLRRIPQGGVTDVSLAVDPGMIFGLLGLNGAGKTTTMRLLVGLLRPDEGSVEVLGGPVTDPAVRRRIGYVPEMPYLPQQLNAAGLLRRYGAMSGMGGRYLSNRVAAVLETVGMEKAAREPIRLFSKGMLQRCAVAQALLHGPEILFADEPMSGLDPEGVREMRELMLRLKSQGVTVVLNSHQIAEVERLCDRVGIMSKGRLVREGAVGEMLTLAKTRVYRLTVLWPKARGRRGKGKGWRIEDLTVREQELAGALAAQRKRGGRVLQIIAQRGSLEEVLVETVKKHA